MWNISTVNNKLTGRPVFDYRSLRFAMGCIALSLSFLVVLISHEPLTSISISYYTNARDIFVGCLFIVGSFLIAYNGHFLHEAILSKVAGIAALTIALEPTSCSVVTDPVICQGVTVPGNPKVHAIAALIHFSILAYFCLGPFRKQAAHKKTAKAKRRVIIYTVCGWTIITAVVAAMLWEFGYIGGHRTVFYAETAALSAFGVAWIVSGHTFKWLAHSDERWNLFRGRVGK